MEHGGYQQEPYVQFWTIPRGLLLLLLTVPQVPATWNLGRTTPWNSPNIWVTLAKALNQTTFCASVQLAAQPFHTCLVGIPLSNSSIVTVSLTSRLNGQKCKNFTSCINERDMEDDALPVASLELQEIDILGSVYFTECLFFNWT